MKPGPRIKPALTPGDKLLEAFSWLVIGLLWIITIVSYPQLPESIPIHYGAAGQADRFGGKANIFSLPIIATILSTGLTVLNKFPHIFNYPTRITPDNARRQYTAATRLIRVLKLIIAVIFAAIAWWTIRTASAEESGPGKWFLPAILVLLFIPVVYFVIKSIPRK